MKKSLVFRAYVAACDSQVLRLFNSFKAHYVSLISCLYCAEFAKRGLAKKQRILP